MIVHRVAVHDQVAQHAEDRESRDGEHQSALPVGVIYSNQGLSSRNPWAACIVPTRVGKVDPEGYVACADVPTAVGTVPAVSGVSAAQRGIPSRAGYSAPTRNQSALSGFSRSLIVRRASRSSFSSVPYFVRVLGAAVRRPWAVLRFAQVRYGGC